MATTETCRDYRLIKFGNEVDARYTASIYMYEGKVILSMNDRWQDPGDPPDVHLSASDLDELILELESARKGLVRGSDGMGPYLDPSCSPELG